MTSPDAPRTCITQTVCGAIQLGTPEPEPVILVKMALFDTRSGPMIAFSGSMGDPLARDMHLVLSLADLTLAIDRLRED